MGEDRGTGARERKGDAPDDRVVMRAHAKSNLRLRVLGRTEDGYHQLETLFLRLGLHDEVVVEPKPDGAPPGLEVTVADEPAWPGRRPTPEGHANLCWRAAELFFGALDREPAAAIRLRKRIPPGSGLGGGSADAAATLRGLNRLQGDPLDEDRLIELAGQLGSDVPFCLAGVPMALGWERGRRLLPLPPLPPRPALVLVPPVAVGAAEAYGWLDEWRAASGSSPAAARLPSTGGPADWTAAEAWAVNDFESVVFDRRPVVARAAAWLEERGASPVQLSGSGSAVIGYFGDADARDAAMNVSSEADGELDEVVALRTRAPVGD